MLYHRRGTYELLSMDETSASLGHSGTGHGSHLSPAAHTDETSASSTTGERQRKYSKK